MLRRRWLAHRNPVDNLLQYLLKGSSVTSIVGIATQLTWTLSHGEYILLHNVQRPTPLSESPLRWKTKAQVLGGHLRRGNRWGRREGGRGRVRELVLGLSALLSAGRYSTIFRLRCLAADASTGWQTDKDDCPCVPPRCGLLHKLCCSFPSSHPNTPQCVLAVTVDRAQPMSSARSAPGPCRLNRSGTCCGPYASMLRLMSPFGRPSRSLGTAQDV
ncbi:hypothetical protein OF83DRAFT_50527 [Amylostereum chailletii]|nr:hypothetical protein OF83DRAFT_50527 [Amylostereum chailletii]